MICYCLYRFLRKGQIKCFKISVKNVTYFSIYPYKYSTLSLNNNIIIMNLLQILFGLLKSFVVPFQKTLSFQGLWKKWDILIGVAYVSIILIMALNRDFLLINLSILCFLNFCLFLLIFRLLVQRLIHSNSLIQEINEDLKEEEGVDYSKESVFKRLLQKSVMYSYPITAYYYLFNKQSMIITAERLNENITDFVSFFSQML